MAAIVAVQNRIGELERRLVEAERVAPDVPQLRVISDLLEELRDEYRRDPAALKQQVQRVSDLRRRFDQLVCKAGGKIADHFLRLNEEIFRLQREREQWRVALITAAEFAPGHRVQGRSSAIEVKAAEALSLPPAGHADRQQIEQLLMEAGVWAKVSQLSGPRLHRALSERCIPPDAADAVLRLCSVTLRHTVRCVAAN